MTDVLIKKGNSDTNTNRGKMVVRHRERISCEGRGLK